MSLFVFFDSFLSPYILHFSDTFWQSMFFLIQFVLRACSYAANIKPLFLSSNNLYKSIPMSPHFWRFLFIMFILVFCLTLPWSSFSIHCLYLSSFFCYLAVDTDPSSHVIIIIVSSYILRSPPPTSILGILSLSLSWWYILFFSIIFCVFFSITFNSSFVHFSIPALYLTKDTVHECIALTVFTSFNFGDVSWLTLLQCSFWTLSFISMCIMSLASKIPKDL